MFDYLTMWIIGGGSVLCLLIWLAIKYEADWVLDILLFPLLLLEDW